MARTTRRNWPGRVTVLLGGFAKAGALFFAITTGFPRIQGANATSQAQPTSVVSTSRNGAPGTNGDTGPGAAGSLQPGFVTRGS